MNTTTATSHDASRPAVQLLAESEVRRLRQAIDDVGQLQASGFLDEEQALRIVALHWETGKTALLTIRRVRVGRPPSTTDGRTRRENHADRT